MRAIVEKGAQFQDRCFGFDDHFSFWLLFANTAGSVQEVESYHQIDQDMAKQMIPGWRHVDARRQDEYDVQAIFLAQFNSNEHWRSGRRNLDLDQIILIYRRSGEQTSSSKACDWYKLTSTNSAGSTPGPESIVTGETTMEIPENIKTIYLCRRLLLGTQSSFDQFVGVTEQKQVMQTDLTKPTYQTSVNSSAAPGRGSTMHPAVDFSDWFAELLFSRWRSALCKQTGQWSRHPVPGRIYYLKKTLSPEIEAVYRARKRKPEPGSLLNCFRWKLLPAEEYHQKTRTWCHIRGYLIFS